MSRYLFIGICCLGLAASALVAGRKLSRVQTRTDELARVLPPLKTYLPQKVSLSCYLEDKSGTEGLIRGRFVLAPLVLVPVDTFKPADTVLLITKPQSPLRVSGRELWSWGDTAIHYSLVIIANGHS